MMRKLLVQILPGLAIAFLGASLRPSYAGSNKFFCTTEGGVPVTKVRTSRGNETFIRWVAANFKDFSPDERCEIVSNKFQRYYDNGALYITSRDNFNGYPVLCIANRKGVPCTPENILVTLKPGTDTGLVLKQMLDFRRGVAASPINLSGGTQYASYVDGDFYVDVKQLLDDAESDSSISIFNTNYSLPEADE